MKTIIHIDFDSFFASCEQQLTPQYRGKPVGVTATNGRNCIIASSVEAKRLGIETAASAWQAKELYPELILTPARFEEYWEISKKFVDICKDFTPYLEVFSIDEVFMDVTPTLHLFHSAENIVGMIKKRIRTEIGEYTTVSAGISYNKLLAKLASGLKKPNGIFEITKENRKKVYMMVPLKKICGIGSRILFRLNAMGIYTLPDLATASLSNLIAGFGKVEGNFLKQVGLGYDESTLTLYTDREDRKSVGRQYCLPGNEFDERAVLQNIYELSEEISIKLRKHEKEGSRVSLYLGGDESRHDAITLPCYISSGKEIYAACKFIYDAWGLFENNESYVRRIGITVSVLQNKGGVQLSFLGNPLKQQKIIKTIDAINTKFGDHTIRNGFLLYADKLTTKPNGFVGE